MYKIIFFPRLHLLYLTTFKIEILKKYNEYFFLLFAHLIYLSQVTNIYMKSKKKSFHFFTISMSYD